MPDEQPASRKPQQADLHRRRTLEASRATLELTAVPTSIGRRLRTTVPTLVERITTTIQREVSGYAGPTTGRGHELIAGAVRVAVEQFVDILEDRPTQHHSAYVHFWHLGRREAQSGHPLDALRAAQLVATHLARLHLRSIVVAEGLPSTLHGVLSNALLTYLHQLLERAVAGYTTAARSTRSVGHRLLFDALMRRHRGEIHRLAETLGWPIGDLVVVAVAERTSEDPLTVSMPDSVVVRAIRNEVGLVMSTAEKDEIVGALRALGSRRAAHSWPVPIAEVPDAYRWVKLALHLAAHGDITDAPIIDCAVHRDLLWLHADPVLGEHVHRELLKPLLSVSMHQRSCLATTMLLWLRTRASAPALAADLGVHDQTVRHRLHTLHDLFGDQLKDPHATVTLLMALEAAVPRWQEQAPSRPRKRRRAHEDDRPEDGSPDGDAS